MQLQKLDLLPERNGYTYKPGNSIVTIELEGGLSRSRVDQVNSASYVDCQWVLNREQYEYFRAFYNGITFKGVAPFLIELILDKSFPQEVQVKFVPDTVEMSDPFGMVLTCKATLELIPINNESEDAVTVLYWPLLTDDPFFAQLATFANVDLEV